MSSTNVSLLEEELRDSQQYLQTVLDAVRAGVIVIDAATHKIVDANQTALQMIGAGREAVVGHVCHQYICKAERGRCPITDLGRTVDLAERVLVTADGRSVSVIKSVVTVERQGRTYLIESFVDLTERKKAEAEREALQERLIEASREAGMAELATGVLHNVGNVLNSVNVSTTLLAEKLRKSKVVRLTQAMELMRQHADDLDAFLTDDESGRRLPGYLAKLAEHLAEEQRDLLAELEQLAKNVEHIKRIINTQQANARAFGVVESVSIADVVNDALTISATSFERYGIQLFREFADLPSVTIDKQKLLQILVNLMRNAKHATLDSGKEEKRLTLRIARSGENRVRIDVIDNGIGIPQENLTRIFAHGFTTKKGGHGFGLHSSALAAKEMNATLTAHSDGPGQGARFTIDLPFKPTEAAPTTPPTPLTVLMIPAAAPLAGAPA